MGTYEANLRNEESSDFAGGNGTLSIQATFLTLASGAGSGCARPPDRPCHCTVAARPPTSGSLLEKARLINHQHAIGIGHLLTHIGLQLLAHRIAVPHAPD